MYNDYAISVIVFTTQVSFILLKSLNIIYVAEKRYIPACSTAAFGGLSWLISLHLGNISIGNMRLLPIVSFLSGNAMGTYIAIAYEQKISERFKSIV